MCRTSPEIWLANPALQTGTSLFDQFRALPRAHTFDANAASALDWMAVPGITPEAAGRMLKGAPYADLQALIAQAGPDAALRAQIASMDSSMAELRRASEVEESLSLWAVARAYIWRLLAYVVAATALGAWLARRTCAVRWRWAIPCGLMSALLVFALSWIVISPGWMPLAAPVLLGGLPAAAWVAVRRRSWKSAALAVATWVMAALPALVLSRNWW